MITQVTASNKKLYQQLWEDATADLKKYDANGELAGDQGSGLPPALSSDAVDYAKVNVTKETYISNTYFIQDGWMEDGSPKYVLDVGPEFDESKVYFMQYATTINSLNEYFSYITILANINPAKYTRLPLDEDFFEIDANARTISVPANFAKNGISIEGDEIAEILYFRIARYFDMDDLATKQIFIEWENAKGNKGISKPWCEVDIDAYPGYLVFGWPIDSKITESAGNVKFSVRFYTLDADNGNMLTYSWATAPSTVSIKTGMNFNISDLVSVNDADVVRKNDDLIYNRLTDSPISSFESTAEAPIFYPYEGDPTAPRGKILNYGDLPELRDMVVDVDSDENYLYAAAYSTDGGAVSYRWLRNSYAPTGYTPIVVSADNYKPSENIYYSKDAENNYVKEATDSVFDENKEYFAPQYGGLETIGVVGSCKMQTLDTSKDTYPEKTYFYKTSKENAIPETFKIYTGDIRRDEITGLGVIDDPSLSLMVNDEPADGSPVYETVTKVKMSGTGRYFCVATNRSNRSTADTKSTVCFVEPPVAPTINTNLKDSGFLSAEDYDLELRVTIQPVERGVVTYKWYRKLPGEAEYTEIEGANTNSYVVDGNAYGSLNLGDGLYKVVINNYLNTENKATESNVCVVTHEPEKPVVKDKGLLVGPENKVIEYTPEDAMTNGFSFEASISDNENAMKAMIEEEKGRVEGITYNWYRVYNIGSRPNYSADEIQNIAYEGNYVPGNEAYSTYDRDMNCSEPIFKPSDGQAAYYYCLVTNTYNGKTATISTPLFQVLPS